MHSQISYLMSLAAENIQKGDLSSAERLLRQSLVMAPKNSETLRLLGVLFAFKKDYEEALQALDDSIKLEPHNWLSHSNRGNVLKELARFEDALKSYERAIDLQPNYAEAHNNKGNLLQELNQLNAALESYDQAVKLQPYYADAYSNAGNALKKLNLFESACSVYEKAISLDGENPSLLGSYINCKMHLCDWGGIKDCIKKLEDLSKRQPGKIHPFDLLAISNDPYAIKHATETFMLSRHPSRSGIGLISQHEPNKKIKLGYFSPDFRDHPVSYLTAGLIECHNKDKFELVAFSMGPEASDAMRDRLKVSFDQFIDVSSKSDLEVAQLARDLKIDLAIDLGGITQNSRPSIFAYRAAPIQIGYIGYLGTMGSPYFDYIIADETIIPAESRDFYTEKMIYLPSYQANDPKRKISDRIFTREEFGIPRNAFVYCCFNNNYKFNPAILDSWASIMLRVNGSVMLLHAEGNTVKRNLLSEFAIRRIDANRIFFVERLPRAEYLSRYRIADLFLDTSPYNAGTTASDALWAGLPVLTFLGQTFSARMGGSLLHAIGLSELVCASQKEYEDLAVDLGLNFSKCGRIKDKLAHKPMSSPLFDIDVFTRNLEAALSRAHERRLTGMLPDHIFI